MEMRFLDKAELGSVRTLDGGYRTAEVPVARTGIQQYAGRELGRPDIAVVNVYRPPETVFDEAYIQSMAHKPVTDDHPSDSVDPTNWTKLAKGYTGDPIRKDVESGLVYVPLVFTAHDTIEKLDAGKREVSCGYTCDIEWKDGLAPDGTPYQAIQTNARINHIALVQRGRAGNVCRVGDNWQPFNKEPERQMKVVSYDSVPFEVADAALAGAFEKAIGERDTARSAINDAERAKGEAVALLDAEKGKVAALEAQLADAKVTPEKLERMVADRAALVDQAKAIVADFDAKGLDDAAIRKAVVVKKLGDKAPTSDAAIEGAFAVLVATSDSGDTLRDTLRGGTVIATDAKGKAQSAYEKMVAEINGGYKGKEA